MTIVSGGPEQVARSPNRAAGKLVIKTVGSPGGSTGPPTWGVGVGTGQVC